MIIDEFIGAPLASTAVDIEPGVDDRLLPGVSEARDRAKGHEQLVQRQLYFAVGAGIVGAVTTGTAAWHILARWPRVIPLGSPPACVLAIALCLCLIGGRGLWRLTRVWRRHCPSAAKRTRLHRRAGEIASESWSRAFPFVAAAGVTDRYGMPQISSRWFLAGLAAGAGFALAGVAALRVRYLLLDRGRTKARPLDPLIGDLADIVASAEALKEVWYRPDVSRFLVNRVEGLARSAEGLRTAGRAPLTELALRKAHRDDLTRLAAAVRRHKHGFAGAHSEEDHARVTEALRTGLAAMLEDDWSALLAQVPPLGPRRRWIHGWPTKNLLPAALLACGAFALPRIPPFSADKTSSLGLTITLGIYALVRIIPGQNPLIDLFDKGVDRGLGKKG